MAEKQYWLMKSEPDVFSIQDLEKAPKQTTHWEGVRNYQARNYLRDSIKCGDLVLYYHSNAEPSGIAGVAEVVKDGYPDTSAFDAKDVHYDPKSKRDNPTWYMVDVKYVETFDPLLSLEMLKGISALKDMVLLQKGSRLSVQPVTKQQWVAVLELAKFQKKASRQK